VRLPERGTTDATEGRRTRVGQVECDANTERPTIDFAKHQLMLAEFSMSPAYGGSEVVDDGSKVTFVTRDRSPCPDDPMPMSSTLAYLLPQGAERSYQQLACTLSARCGDAARR
jgi:hypothetical protein